MLTTNSNSQYRILDEEISVTEGLIDLQPEPPLTIIDRIVVFRVGQQARKTTPKECCLEELISFTFYSFSKTTWEAGKLQTIQNIIIIIPPSEVHLFCVDTLWKIIPFRFFPEIICSGPTKFHLSKSIWLCGYISVAHCQRKDLIFFFLLG